MYQQMYTYMCIHLYERCIHMYMGVGHSLLFPKTPHVIWIYRYLTTWLGHAPIGHGIFDTWFCTARGQQHVQQHVEHYVKHFGKTYTKGGAASGPPFVGMVRNASHNALHAADHAAGHAAGHAVQNHVLKIMNPDLGMPKPCI